MDNFVAVMSMATAVVVLVTAIVTYRTRREVRQVHVLVNSRMDAALERIEELTAALVESDTEVPDDTERPKRMPPVIP